MTTGATMIDRKSTDSELDSWMESRIYPVMSDVPALSDLITSMVASGYDYRRDDDRSEE
ncbi:phage tail terminator protein, partial [Escherichia coli]|uniref:phage tail terminator protein n=1 Tax=Escherichia coli TaxID=562 RepID=UPI003D9EF539